ncbi:MAG: hypothetical protein KF716_14240 [Anaerolineae bacterium]|nr:hypothetical protein [Anaerolineae bacterium]
MAKKRQLTAQLPITPCTPEMRDNMESIAEKRGVSLAAIQREAYSFFLSSVDSKAIFNSKAEISVKKGA